MLSLLMKIPFKIFVAVSGGPDSMAVLDFLKNAHDVTILHFNHGTKHGMEAEEFVKNYAKKENISYKIGGKKHIVSPPKGVSKEHYWRECRYNFFNKVVGSDQTLVLAHNLDDAVETWIFSSIHGKPKLIPPRRDNIIRPFLLTKKEELRNWCRRKDVPFLDDPSNFDSKYPRSRIRNVILPEVLKINPGIYKVVAKKYRN